MLVGVLAVGDDDRAAGVVETGRVPGGDAEPVDLRMQRRQLGELLGCRVAPRVLVDVEGARLASLAPDRYFHGEDLVTEPSLVRGGDRAHVRVVRPVVLLLAAHARLDRSVPADR